MIRQGLTLLIAGLLVIPFAGCGKKQGAASELLGSVTGTVAGIQWTVPSRWTAQGQRPMRTATYLAPAAEGDAEGGECAVFYFGNAVGGSVDQNIERWAGQFENAVIAERSMKDVHGMKTTLVKITGNYLAPSGPMMMPSGKKDNYVLLGGIVEAPEGLVFYKFTGPVKTITASTAEFNALVESARKPS